MITAIVGIASGVGTVVLGILNITGEFLTILERWRLLEMLMLVMMAEQLD